MYAIPLSKSPKALIQRGYTLAALADASMPVPDGRRTAMRYDARTGHIEEAIQEIYRRHWKEVSALAPRLLGKLVEDTARNVFALVRANIAYVPDPDGLQLPKTPARAWADRTGDCKTYSIFIASLLRALNVPHSFRYVAYSKDADYTHVYVVAHCPCGTDYILDACMADFNTETPYQRKKDIMVDVYKLSGLNTASSTIPAATASYDANVLNTAIQRIQQAGDSPCTRSLTKASIQYLTDLRNTQGNTAALDAIDALAEAGAYDYGDFGIHPACRPGGASYVDYLQARQRAVSCLVQARQCGQSASAVPLMMQGAIQGCSLPVRQQFNRIILLLPLNDYMAVGIGGIGRLEQARIGFLKKLWQGVKNVVNKVTDVGKTVVLAPARNAYLGLIALNVRHWASKLSRGNWDEIAKKWDSLGGKPDALRKAIDSGSKKKGLFGVDGDIVAIGCPTPHIGDPGTGGVAATITAAAPVITAMIPILKAIKKNPGESEDGDTLDLTNDILNAAAAAAGAAGSLGITEEDTAEQWRNAFDQGAGYIEKGSNLIDTGKGLWNDLEETARKIKEVATGGSQSEPEVTVPESVIKANVSARELASGQGIMQVSAASKNMTQAELKAMLRNPDKAALLRFTEMPNYQQQGGSNGSNNLLWIALAGGAGLFLFRNQIFGTGKRKAA